MPSMSYKLGSPLFNNLDSTIYGPGFEIPMLKSGWDPCISTYLGVIYYIKVGWDAGLSTYLGVIYYIKVGWDASLSTYLGVRVLYYSLAEIQVSTHTEGHPAPPHWSFHHHRSHNHKYSYPKPGKYKRFMINHNSVINYAHNFHI